MSLFFFFNDTATTEIYTLTLHDALPICAERVEKALELVDHVAPGVLQTLHQHLARPVAVGEPRGQESAEGRVLLERRDHLVIDRKSTRLNSSHSQISYAVFCLRKKTRTD